MLGPELISSIPDVEVLIKHFNEQGEYNQNFGQLLICEQKKSIPKQRNDHSGSHDAQAV